MQPFPSACKGIYRENRPFCYSLEVSLWESHKPLKARLWAKVIIFPLQSLAPKFSLRPSCIFWQNHPGVSVLGVAVFLSGFLKHAGGSLTPGVPLAKDPTRLCGQINCGVWLTFTLLTSMSICFRRRQSFRPTELSSYSERLLIVGQDPWRTLHLLTLWIFHNSNFEGPCSWKCFWKGFDFNGHFMTEQDDFWQLF